MKPRTVLLSVCEASQWRLMQRIVSRGAYPETIPFKTFLRNFLYYCRYSNNVITKLSVHTCRTIQKTENAAESFSVFHFDFFTFYNFWLWVFRDFSSINSSNRRWKMRETSYEMRQLTSQVVKATVINRHRERWCHWECQRSQLWQS